MDSVAATVPQNTVRMCGLEGCNRPVLRRNRIYCSRHRCFADIDYIQDLWDRPDISAAREAIQQQDELEHLMTPLQRMEVALKDVERVTGILRSFFSKRPAPPRLSLFQREAREAWERYYMGDPDLLDLFIRRYLVRLKHTDGPVPIKLRIRVKRLLDSCFAPVEPYYAPGEWFLFNRMVLIKLNLLVSTNLKMTGSLKYSLSGDERSITANRQDKLPNASALAWQTIQWDRADSRTLLNHVEAYLKSEGHESPKLLRYAEQKSGPFVRDDDSDDDLAQFEAREAARQEVEALPRLIEKAAFSKSESVVYEYDSKVGTEFDTIEDATKAAAHYLSVAPTTVRTYRFRYRKALRQAAEK